MTFPGVASSNDGESGEHPKVELFTDGACTGNPGPGGWAYLRRHVASGQTKRETGGERLTTNNRMEMVAVIRGLEALTKPAVVHLHSDSEYVVAGITQRMARHRAYGWRKTPKSKAQIKNVDLWRKLYDLVQRHQVTASWVRGHAGHPENELCDRLAVEAAEAAARLPMPELPGPTMPEALSLFGSDDE